MKGRAMIHLTDEIVKKIERDAEHTYPDECCGFLLGESNDTRYVILDCMAIENRQEENRRRRFLITPDQYRLAEEVARSSNHELLGFYHSHPDHPAAPSAFDTEHALPWFIYLILSVTAGKATTLTAWQLEESRAQFREQPMVVDHASPLSPNGVRRTSMHPTPRGRYPQQKESSWR
jgi:proteasome lid subunit RPN8/RPN11